MVHYMAKIHPYQSSPFRIHPNFNTYHLPISSKI